MTAEMKNNGPSISEQLADWLVGVDLAAIPDRARDAALDTTIDVVGLCLAARENDYTKAALAAWTGSGPCTIFGIGETRDAYSAALINGTAAHGEDFDNTFEGCPVHSGAVIVPAVLAMAESEGIGGARTVSALAVGIELMCRLGLVARKGIHTAGFHPTAILGTLSAAAAAGVMLGLDRKQFVDTLGVAGSMASGIIEYLSDGSWTKRMHPGWAAQAGMRAARMGQAGFRGPRTVFEGEHGLFKSFAPSLSPDFSQLVGELGATWQMENVAFKPYACGTMTQPYIDCAIALRNDGVRPQDIVEIVCETAHGTVHRLWEPLELKQRPPNGYAAKFSTPYCVAVGLIDGEAGLQQFTDDRTADPDIAELAGRVRYEIDPDNEYPLNYTGHLRAVLSDGRIIEKRQHTLRGGARQPMARDEIVRKYLKNASYGAIDDGKANALLEAILSISTTGSAVEIGKAARRGSI
jgi:2-methylcitrate dehydratase PrpD